MFRLIQHPVEVVRYEPGAPAQGRAADSFRSAGGWGRHLAERIGGTNARVDLPRPGTAGVRKPPRERMPGLARVGSLPDPGGPHAPAPEPAARAGASGSCRTTTTGA